MLRIGDHTLANRVALAPMAGVTDLPFRRLCTRFGAGYAVAEMVTADPTLRTSRKSRLRSRHDGEGEPRAVQIVGGDPALLAAAARHNVALGAQIIDINMGCPAKKVCRKAAGSALLADEALVAEILGAVVAAVDVPVTLKLRTGPTPERRNGVTIARIAEDAGIAALAVHGRSRACAFAGEAEYDTIAAMVAATSIPVWANGDIGSPTKAAAVLAHTGAAGVMIGRAAQGRPWLCGQIAAHLAGDPVPADPDHDTQLTVLREHLAALHVFYGDFLGPRIARKHVGWYLSAAAVGDDTRRRFNRLETPAEQLDFLADLATRQPTQDLAA
ncbi:tRNA dihydrouridine synthase DusB [Pseudohaliea rubra]|uniref:tRNA-dihydrouridine synthase B n=1 Tax=Pseudohaliea rubra DSM 19751 TaxID=1265313 RepID=A0A095VN81_9GAMM|nr:tRNA dihydrouridine synthase DusB [Pseudohaliea rubra]KGE02845.1 tRNA dihydrouridine synthase B [Pseudohaliea rubra DSM 19751]